MEKLFKLQSHGTTVSREALSGLTTFLTLSYILFVNPVVMSHGGMPLEGAFVATVLAAAFCTIFMAFAANVPLAMAPGMGLNTFIAYTVCGALGYDWREALALCFLAGLLHILIMVTPLRKSLVNAIPKHLKLAFGVGLGLFIAYTGLKGGGLLTFLLPAGEYSITIDGSIIGSSAAVPGFVGSLGNYEIVALIGLAVMIILLAFERKTGDSYAALPMGIVAGAAVGIPLEVTDPIGAQFFDLSSIGALGEVFASFLGRPGLMSLFDGQERFFLSLLVILIVLLISATDSVGTIMGIGQIKDAEIFGQEDMEKFAVSSHESRLDKSLMVNSVGGAVAAVFGTSTTTSYMESVTGIVAGGRTGLSALTVGALFLLCLPFSGVFGIIPPAAIAPALIVAGALMMPMVSRIHWSRFEESLPAFMVILCIPLTYSFVYGIAAGILSHVLIQLALGRWRRVHPILYIVALIFLLVLGCSEYI